jgi:hypothetical protein
MLILLHLAAEGTGVGLCLVPKLRSQNVGVLVAFPDLEVVDIQERRSSYCVIVCFYPQIIQLRCLLFCRLLRMLGRLSRPFHCCWFLVRTCLRSYCKAAGCKSRTACWGGRLLLAAHCLRRSAPWTSCTRSLGCSWIEIRSSSSSTCPSFVCCCGTFWGCLSLRRFGLIRHPWALISRRFCPCDGCFAWSCCSHCWCAKTNLMFLNFRILYK